MYRVLYYENHADKEPKVVHEPNTFGNKVTSGIIKQSRDEIDSFEFTINIYNTNYNKINLFTGLIKVINEVDGTMEFYGRVLKPEGAMSSAGSFSQTYICEDLLGYLHDSTQDFAKIPNQGARQYFGWIIAKHNEQVEPHKRFLIGRTTVTDKTDLPNRYIGYETTFDTIKESILERIGGYITIDHRPEGMFIEWLESVGEERTTPIQLGTNILSAKRSIDVEGLITRLVPIGADLDEGEVRDEESGQYVIRERVDIKSVNKGVRYIEDPELVKMFGIIQKPVNWTDISSPHILKLRGQQYMQNQRVAVASWEIDAVELHWIDGKKFEKFEVNNIHPILNAPLSGVEKLQIIDREVDILRPQRIRITIGSKSQTLSAFQLQQQEATKSMEKVMAENEAKRKEEERKQQEAFEDELKKQNEALKEGLKTQELKMELSTAESELSSLNSQIQSQQALLNAERGKKTADQNTQFINTLNSHISSLQARKHNLEKQIANLKAQLTT